jgi:hypothetical protein
MALSIVRDYAHALGVAFQANAGTFVPTPGGQYLCWMTAPPEHTPEIAHDTPDFQRWHRWSEVESYDTTRVDSITIRGYVDSFEQGFFLMSVMGPDAYASSTHVFNPGRINISNWQPLLSVQLSHGQMTSSTFPGSSMGVECLKDCRVTNLSWILESPGGRWLYEATLVGIAIDDAEVAVPTFTTTGKVFSFAATVFNRNTQDMPLISGRINWLNTATPIYNTPVAADLPTSTDPLYVNPVRFSEGKVSGTVDVVAGSMPVKHNGTFGLLNQLYADYKKNAIYPWLISASIPGDVGNSFVLKLPRPSWTSGSIDKGQDDPRQRLSGVLLYNGTELSGTEVQLKGPKGAAYNS